MNFKQYKFIFNRNLSEEQQDVFSSYFQHLVIPSIKNKLEQIKKDFKTNKGLRTLAGISAQNSILFNTLIAKCDIITNNVEEYIKLEKLSNKEYLFSFAYEDMSFYKQKINLFGRKIDLALKRAESDEKNIINNFNKLCLPKMKLKERDVIVKESMTGEEDNKTGKP